MSLRGRLDIALSRAGAFIAGNVASIFFVLAAGWGMAFFAWEVAHRSLLPAFLLSNDLAPALRGELLRLLVLGPAVAVLLWGLSGLAARLAGHRVLGLMQGVAGIAFALTLLPFLPILAIEGIETSHPFLVFFSSA